MLVFYHFPTKKTLFGFVTQLFARIKSQIQVKLSVPTSFFQDGTKECQFLKTFTRSMLCKQGTTFMPYMPYCLWTCGGRTPF